MKVALDATPLTLSSGGILRYTWELSRALAEQFPADDFYLVSDQPFQMRASGPRNWMERRWWLYGVQREISRLGAALFHGTNFAVPWLPLRPSVMTVHDLSPWLDPAWHQGARQVRRRTPYMAGLGLATMVITPSEAVRRQVIARFRLHPGRVQAVPHAAAAVFRPVAGSPRMAPYFLYAGTLEPRKNLDMLLGVWREVHSRYGVELVLAGRTRSDFRAPAPEPGLHVLGEVPDEDLAALYTGAVACLYPSLYEGFGFPVLEAMQCGATVIASRDPAVRELAGEAAILLDAHAPADWWEAMTAAATEAESRAGWRARALARAKLFSWECAARLTHEVYLEALARFGEG